MTRLIAQQYGKSHVRLTKIRREGSRHELMDCTVQALLSGEFSRSYTDGDNSLVIPTDTIKNTIYVLAKQHSWDAPETFCQLLSNYFLEKFPQVNATDVSIAMNTWDRIHVQGQGHDRAFHQSLGERTARVRCIRHQSPTCQGGIQSLHVLKTSDSEFEGFLRDEYTTLENTTDRILATILDAKWTYASLPIDPNRTFSSARSAVLTTFANHYSRSVQQTLYAIGQAVLNDSPEIQEISIVMPNRHHLLFDLQRFGLTNANEIFVATEQPSGWIEGTVTREA